MIGEFTRKALERVQSKLERLIEDGFDPEVVCVHAYQPLLKFIHHPSTVPVRLDLPWHMASSDLKSLHIRRCGPHPTFVDEDGVLIWADKQLDKAFCDEFHSSIYGCDLPAAEKFERHYIQFYDDSTRKPDTELANRWHAARLELMRTLEGIQPREWPSLWQGLPEHLATRNKSADGWFDVVFQLGLKAFSGCPVQLSYHYPLNERLGRISDWNPSKRPFRWDDPSPFPGWGFQIKNFATASMGAIDWLIANWPDEGKAKGNQGKVAVVDQELRDKCLAIVASGKLRLGRRRIVEMVCNAHHEIELSVLAADPQICWGKAPWDRQWSKAQSGINKVLKEVGARLARRESAVGLDLFTKKKRSIKGVKRQ